ncbi:MAG: C4-dicarboxylate ABC transporter permease [Burkholderiales bacterium PBB3]|nr:MAG: C4-dicarboxylate ABC transporter permease [Burkholderiales bacterium PBB3]
MAPALAQGLARWLDRLARLCALMGGGLLMAILLVTCASVIGRNLLERSLVGDFEFTGLACGVAVALFMPWCQLRRGHILVDFFTARASAPTVAWLDRCGALLLAVCMLGLAWRVAVGGLNAYANFSTSMLLGLPHWWVYAGMAPALALTALIGLHQALWPQRLLCPPQAQAVSP